MSGNPLVTRYAIARRASGARPRPIGSHPARGWHACGAAALLTLTVGASASAAPAAAPHDAIAAPVSPVGGERVTMFELPPGTVYLNGGVDRRQAERMRRDAPHWPLRITFSDRSSNGFVAGVRLQVFDDRGNAVLRLNGAGPMTFVQLPQGDYRITADYRGDQLTRSVRVGPGGLDTNFHWSF